MQIDVKGRNLQVTDEISDYAEKRFAKIAKQVSELAELDLEVADENVPGDPIAATAVLRLKGKELRRAAVYEMAGVGDDGAPGESVILRVTRGADGVEIGDD